MSNATLDDKTKARVTAHLLAAIAKVKEACADAERDVAAGNMAAVQRVMTRLTWGQANANTLIENALTAIEDGYEKAVHDVQLDTARARIAP